MKISSNITALITGGASGIGKIMARMLLQRGASVIIWDINPKSIDKTLHELSAFGNIKGYCVDIADADQMLSMANKVKEEFASIDLLINNAGIVVGKYFHEHSEIDVSKTMQINAQAPMLVAHAFLENMLKNNQGHICNIASSGGLLANPKMSVYAASKWAVIGWSESLRLELKQLGKNVHVTTIMPYYINTGMFDGVKSKLPILQPESTAKKILSAIEQNKKMVTFPGYIYRTLRLAQALFPIDVFDWFVGKVLGIYKTMEHFIGRKTQS